jgi:hypothetical protein
MFAETQAELVDGPRFSFKFPALAAARNVTRPALWNASWCFFHFDDRGAVVQSETAAQK